MNSSIVIREHRVSDRQRIMELLRMNIPEYFSPEEESDMEMYLDNYADNYYVVELDGIIEGCGGFNIAEDGVTAKISWDFFNPQYQGCGLGSALTRHRIKTISTLPNIDILSVRTSQLAYKFYEKFGMQLREVVENYWAEGFDLYRLDCKIDVAQALVERLENC